MFKVNSRDKTQLKLGCFFYLLIFAFSLAALYIELSLRDILSFEMLGLQGLIWAFILLCLFTIGHKVSYKITRTHIIEESSCFTWVLKQRKQGITKYDTLKLSPDYLFSGPSHALFAADAYSLHLINQKSKYPEKGKIE